MMRKKKIYLKIQDLKRPRKKIRKKLKKQQPNNSNLSKILKLRINQLQHLLNQKPKINSNQSNLPRVQLKKAIMTVLKIVILSS
jgi:4-diphosphocytidyl-2C-methyl-D-erythritol kinase